MSPDNNTCTPRMHCVSSAPLGPKNKKKSDIFDAGAGEKNPGIHACTHREPGEKLIVPAIIRVESTRSTGLSLVIHFFLRRQSV